MKSEIVILANNIRSLWNVGSLFRTCDAFGAEKLILTGYTAAPPRKEIAKTAIGAEEWVKWEHEKDPSIAIRKLKNQGFRIVALEVAEDSVDICKYTAPDKICMIIGHEVLGVPKNLLDLCDDVVHIPMHGRKESLNVAVAAGVALHEMRNTRS